MMSNTETKNRKGGKNGDAATEGSIEEIGFSS
jgi:hypothetical protein